MANNRMSLKCRSCGAEFFLAKTYLDGYYRKHKDWGDFEDLLNEFLDNHHDCWDEDLSILPEYRYKLSYEIKE